MISNYPNLILIFLLSVVLSFLFTKLVIYLAAKLKIFDQPDFDIKIHKKPVPLLGGLAIYLTLLIAAVFMWQKGFLLDARIDPWLIFWFFVAGAVLIFSGFLDDKYKLTPKWSILGPLSAVGIVMVSGLKISYITHPDGGVLYLDKIFASGSFLSALIPLFLTFFWLLGMTYTTKLLDGLDGLVGSIGTIATLIIFFVSLSWDVVGSTTSVLSLALAGAILGFLLLNWHPAKIFLGEGGSTFIGFSLAVLAIVSGSKIATALLVMGLPVLDIVWVMVRRWQQGRPIWQGDNEHLHFRLLRAGLGQRRSVLFMSAISLCFGLTALLLTTKTKISALAFLLIFMLGLNIWLNRKLQKPHEKIS